MWVYLSHFGLTVKSLAASGSAGLATQGILNNLFDGAAAVIGFFVISGFCIHYPFRKPGRLAIGQFYMRRYVRILIPLVVSVGIARLIGSDLMGFYSSILWSLAAELIYYTLYPLLRPALFRWGFWPVIAASFAAAAVVIATNPRAGNFHEYGPALTWIVGLPCWLLGCLLASNPRLPSAVHLSTIWMWRLTMWALSTAAAILRFHGGIGYPISLTLLAPLIYLWLKREITWYGERRPLGIFEYCGQFSYSIYLFHGLAIAMLAFVAHDVLGTAWLVPRTLFVIASSYVFFLAVERPGHRLARYLARQFPAAPRAQ